MWLIGSILNWFLTKYNIFGNFLLILFYHKMLSFIVCIVSSLICFNSSKKLFWIAPCDNTLQTLSHGPLLMLDVGRERFPRAWQFLMRNQINSITLSILVLELIDHHSIIHLEYWVLSLAEQSKILLKHQLRRGDCLSCFKVCLGVKIFSCSKNLINFPLFYNTI